MASAQFHVNGTADVYIGSVLLGYSQDGVTISLHYETEDIHTDYMGSKIPEDVMNLGQWATVKMNLIKYDTAILNNLQKRINDGTHGAAPNYYNGSAIGELMSQCQDYVVLQIRRYNPACEAATLEGGWKFNATYLADIDSFKVGTRVTVHDLTFRCLPDASGVLFTVIGTATPS